MKNGQLKINVGNNNGYIFKQIQVNDGFTHEVKITFDIFGTTILLDNLYQHSGVSYSSSSAQAYIGGTFPEAPSMMTNGLYSTGFIGCIKEMYKSENGGAPENIDFQREILPSSSMSFLDCSQLPLPPPPTVRPTARPPFVTSTATTTTTTTTTTTEEQCLYEEASFGGTKKNN